MTPYMCQSDVLFLKKKKTDNKQENIKKDAA